MQRVKWGIIALVLVLGTAGLSQAIGLNLEMSGADIYIGNITITYNATTDLLSASGVALQYYAPPSYAITGGSFNLMANVDENGHASAGSVVIGGSTAGKSGTLLSGSLAEFGFTPDGEIGAPTFEFVMNVTGGALAKAFGGIGGHFGMTLSSFSSFAGAFDSNYRGRAGMADAFGQVPEPATLSLLGFGIAAVSLRIRRKTAA